MSADLPAAAPEAAAAEPDFRLVIRRIVDWHNGLHWVIRVTLSVLLFALMTAFYVILFFKSDDLPTFLAICAAISPLVMAVIFLSRFVSKRQINELSGAMLFSALVPFSLTSFVQAAVIWEGSQREFGNVITGNAMAAVVVLILLTAAFAIYKFSSGNKSDADSLLQALPVVAGIAAVILVFRVMDPDLGRVNSNSRTEVQYIIGALTSLVAIIAYYWRRQDVAAFLLWPLTAWVVCIAIGNSDVSNGEFSGQNRLVYQATPLVLFGFVPAFLWWFFQLYVDRQAGKLDTSDRFGVRIKALYRHWERNELVGKGAIEQLPHRKDQLFNDIAYIILSLAALVAFVIAADDSNVPDTIWVPFASGFLGIGYLAVCSLVRRALWAQRIRFSATVPAAIMSVPISFAIAMVLWEGIEPQLSSNMEEYVVALQVLLWLATQHLCLRLLRNVDFTTVRVRAGALSLLGTFVAFFVFRFFMGPENFALFDVGLPVGDAGWLLTILFLAPVYFYHYQEKSSFIVWPIGAAAAGTMLSIVVRAETRLGEIADFIAVQADIREVLLAALFGAAAGSLGLLAKQVWFDKDPAKRARAIRVVGFFTILHAITPVLLLLVFLSVASSFRTNATIIVTDALGNVTQLTASVVKIKDRAQDGVLRLKKQAEDLVEQVSITIPAEALQLAEELKDQTTVLINQSTAAAKEVATVAVNKAKEAATKTLTEVGDALSEALTPEIDFGFLGKLEMPDLGIGKFFKNMIGGLIPDFNLEALFQQAMTSLYADVEKQFEAPIQTAKNMQAKVEGFVDKQKTMLINTKDKALADAKAMTADILKEKENTIKIINALVVNTITFFYQLLIFLLLTTATIIGYLAWKVMNGLVFMMIRIGIGWTMLRYAVDAAAPKKAG